MLRLVINAKNLLLSAEHHENCSARLSPTRLLKPRPDMVGTYNWDSKCFFSNFIEGFRVRYCICVLYSIMSQFNGSSRMIMFVIPLKFSCLRFKSESEKNSHPSAVCRAQPSTKTAKHNNLEFLELNSSSNRMLNVLKVCIESWKNIHISSLQTN